MNVMYSEYTSVSTQKLKGNTKRQYHECLRERGMSLKTINKGEKEGKKRGTMNTSGQKEQETKKTK